MPTTTTPPPTVNSADRGRALLRRPAEERKENSFRFLTMGSGIVVLAVLALIALSTTSRSWDAFASQGIGFITSSEWAPNRGKFGALAFIYGTVLVSTIALVLAVPVSIGIALFVTEVAPKTVRKGVGYIIDLLAAIPSVVYGLWGLLVLAPTLEPVYESIGGAVGEWPVLSLFFGGQAYGKSFMTAGIILAIMITPIITSLSREVLLTVPGAQREAALALGATRWETIRASVLPWAKGGITGSVMLGLGRAMGETIAVALVIGSSNQITTELFSSGDAMPAVIVNEFPEAADTHRAALIGLGVVLFGITILVNVLARSIVKRSERRLGV